MKRVTKPTTVEKVWKTEAGYEGLAVLTRGKFRCGYVGVPVGHPLYEVHYNTATSFLKDIPEDEPFGERSPIIALLAGARESLNSMDIVFDVHGSITFSDFWERSELEGANPDLWYIGFDCNHSGDGNYPDEFEDGSFDTRWDTGKEVKSLEFVIAQCEKLAKQISERTNFTNLLEFKPESTDEEKEV